MKTKKLVTAAFLAAIMFVSQVAISFLPNIEPVTLLVILFTLVFGMKQSLTVIYLFAALEGLFYGFGIWWIMYLYVWTILAVAVWLCRKNNSVLVWAVIAGFYGLCFGALCAIPYGIIGGFYAGVAYWVAGIPFDIAHCVGNVLMILLLFTPMKKVLEKAKTMTFRQ
ncbi:MAG: hypothetical protein RR162_06940 [Oscillospiraceae bacterium]